MARRFTTDAADIAWNLLFFWLIRARGTEALQWCQRVLNLASVPAGARAKALVGGSVMWYTQGQVGHAREWLTRASSPGPDIDADVAAMAEILMGHVEQAGGHQEPARERFTRSMEQFRTISSAWGVGNALMGIASVALASGDIVTAERVLDEATTELQQAGPWTAVRPETRILYSLRSDRTAVLAAQSAARAAGNQPKGSGDIKGRSPLAGS
jgi:hypothetical protein